MLFSDKLKIGHISLCAYLLQCQRAKIVFVSPYMENRFQGDTQLFDRTCIFVKNANIKFSHFFGTITWSAFFVELNFFFVRTKSVNFPAILCIKKCLSISENF